MVGTARQTRHESMLARIQHANEAVHRLIKVADPDPVGSDLFFAKFGSGFVKLFKNKKIKIVLLSTFSDKFSKLFM